MAKKQNHDDDKDAVIADEAAAEVAYQKTLTDAKPDETPDEDINAMHRRIEQEAVANDANNRK